MIHESLKTEFYKNPINPILVHYLCTNRATNVIFYLSYINKCHSASSFKTWINIVIDLFGATQFGTDIYIVESIPFHTGSKYCSFLLRGHGLYHLCTHSGSMSFVVIKCQQTRKSVSRWLIRCIWLLKYIYMVYGTRTPTITPSLLP